MMQPCIALVEWDDAQMDGGWEALAEKPTPPDLTCFSAGFLIHEDENIIVMVQSLTDGSTGNRLVVPAGWVRKVTRIPLV